MFANASYHRCVRRSVLSHPVHSPALMLQVDPRGKMWNRLRASIGQPNFE